MRATLICVTAAAAFALAGSAASAQGVYIGGHGGGVGVGVDVGSPGYRHRAYRDREVYTEGYNRSYARCRTTVIRHADGSVTKARRCRD